MTHFTDNDWSDPSADLEADEYCSICLIDYNPEGEPKTKSKCKLPIREAPGKPVNRNALRSAARLFSQTQAPDDKKEEARQRLKDLCAEAGIEAKNLTQEGVPQDGVPSRPGQELQHITLALGADLAVTIIKAGTANGLNYSPELLQKHVPLFEQRPVFCDHAQGGFFGPENRSVRDLVGEIVTPRWDAATQSIKAKLNIYPHANWLRDLALNAARHPWFGLSADMWLSRNDRDVALIHSVESVDIVINPAAGGAIETKKEPLAMTQNTPAPTTEYVRATNSQNDAQGESTRPPAQIGLTPEQLAQSAALLAQQKAALAVLQILTSDLPRTYQNTLREDLQAGRIPPDQVDDRITTIRATLAKEAENRAILGMGRVSVVSEPLDRIALAFDRLMGLPVTQDVPRLSGIRELYHLLTGDYEMQGIYRPERVTLAAATTTTLNSVVANTLNKVLLRAFEMRPQWWRQIVYEEDFNSLNQIKWITLAGFADLATVAEGDAYAEGSISDNEETTSFTKYGNYIGITLESIDRDDVSAIRAIPRKLGLAAYRTLSKEISDIFTDNSGVGPTLSDSKALFHADHANLGTSALTADNWDTTIQAMFKQAELGSSKRLGIRPRYCLVPIELEKTALTIFDSDREPGTADNDANVRRMPNSVITVPEWTDTNNWAAVADPGDLEGVCIGYRYGRAPELFVASDDLVGSMFTHDEMRIKVRFFFGVGIGDYRALYKHNVA
jgi:hypothetical protein